MKTTTLLILLIIFLGLIFSGCSILNQQVAPSLETNGADEIISTINNVKTNSSTTIQIPVLEDSSTFNYWTAGQYGPSVATVSPTGVRIMDRGHKTYCWFKFDVSGIPEGATINLATFNGYVVNHKDYYGGYEIGSYYVYDDSWHEALYFDDPNGITWNSQPTDFNPNYTDSILPTTFPSWYSWDVNNAVQDAYQNDVIITLLIKFVSDTYPDLISDPLNYSERALMGFFQDGLRTNSYLSIEYKMPLDIPVDIKPQSCPNPLNVKSRRVLPVAILGTEDFDVTEIDPALIMLEGVSPLRWALEDVAAPKGELEECTTAGPDGYIDLTLKFDVQEIVAALGGVSDGDVLVLKLTGNLQTGFGGTPIEGEDVIIIIKKGN